MTIVKSVNLAVAFLLELSALAALAYWGFQTGGSLPGQIVLGLGAPLLLAAGWGLFMAPKAGRRVPLPWRLILQVAIFGLAAAALAGAGQPPLAAVFAVFAVINAILLYVWREA